MIVVREGERLVLGMVGDMKDKKIKFWIDDIRIPSQDYFWIKTVKDAIIAIQEAEALHFIITEISLDHDAGDYGHPNYIKLLDWLEETNRNIPIHIHSMNPIGIANMRAIIQRNKWKEV